MRVNEREQSSYGTVFDRAVFRPPTFLRVFMAIVAVAAIATGVWEGLLPEHGPMPSLPLIGVSALVALGAIGRFTSELTLTMDGARHASLFGSREVLWSDVGRAVVLPELKSMELRHSKIAVRVLLVFMIAVPFLVSKAIDKSPEASIRWLFFGLAVMGGALLLVSLFGLLRTRWISLEPRPDCALVLRGPRGDALLTLPAPISVEERRVLVACLEAAGVPIEELGRSVDE